MLLQLHAAIVLLAQHYPTGSTRTNACDLLLAAQDSLFQQYSEWGVDFIKNVRLLDARSKQKKEKRTC